MQDIDAGLDAEPVEDRPRRSLQRRAVAGPQQGHEIGVGGKQFGMTDRQAFRLVQGREEDEARRVDLAPLACREVASAVGKENVAACQKGHGDDEGRGKRQTPFKGHAL